MIRSRTFNRALGLLCSALMLGPTSVLANPLGGQVVGGQATIQGQGTKTVTVTQGTQNAIINWSTFNIGTGELTQFIQPNASAIALNRVVGGLGPSLLNGTLTANGRIFLVNPNGVLIGSGGVINTAGFLATTHDITNADFMAGNYKFTIPGRPDASVVNLGQITATDGGFAALVAPGVRNAGVITANLGHVALAAGNGFTLDFYGDQLITLQVGDKIANKVIDVATGQPLDALVKNEGMLRANGGQVALTAAAARHVVDSVINNKGVIEANSVGMRNGMIVLGAATAGTKHVRAKQTVKVSGTLSAAGQRAGEKGGAIQITGENIVLAGAKLDAPGQAGGGTVLVGATSKATPGSSDGQPQTSFVATASGVTIDANSLIDASAKSTGDGGRVVVWSTGLTSVTGSILATGGATGGNGGFVETSGQTVNFTGIRVNTSAPAGTTGMWLIDPTNLTVDQAAATTISSNLANTDITLRTTQDEGATGPGIQTPGAGDIIINAAISWASNTTLTLDAFHGININAPITVAGAGTFNLHAAIDENSVPMLSFGSGASVRFTSAEREGSLVINEQPYTLLYSMDQVQGINGFKNLGGHYALAQSLNASDLDGWTPIGTNTDGNVMNDGRGFIGTFQGLGNTISNLTVDVSQRGGLFGFVGQGGVVANIGLRGGTVSGESRTGALVGENYGIVTGSFANTTVNGSDAIGGLVGANYGTVSYSHASGTVNGGQDPDDVGGLVGYNGRIQSLNGTVLATISQSYATGAVSGAYDVGGLVGHNDGAVSYSYATGSVSGGTTANNFGLGGLVGYNTGNITQSYATGSASGANNVGGLVGWNSGSIGQSYAIGAASGLGNVGGLVGSNGGTVTETFASGQVSGPSHVGGLVGTNSLTFPGIEEPPRAGTVSSSYWDTQTTGQQTSAGSNANLFGLTTAQSFQHSSYAGWTFGTGGTWFMIDGATRPFLQSEYSTTITNTHQLQLMAMDLNADYRLAKNLAFGTSFSNPSDMWGSTSPDFVSQGFVPIGSRVDTAFTGTFDGRHHKIDGLVITPTDPNITNIGLFGVNSGTIKNVRLTNAAISANSSSIVATQVATQYVGTLAGQNFGIISHVSATGTVDGGDLAGVAAGGLVGQNSVRTGDGDDIPGVIRHASANVAVTIGTGNSCNPCEGPGWNYAGGLVGINGGVINHGSAHGDVISGSRSFAGGLVGQNANLVQGTSVVPRIRNSFATGDVFSAGADVSLGGLVGLNGLGGGTDGGTIDITARIRDSYATGNVTSTGDNSNVRIGGLVGENSGSIRGHLLPSIGDTHLSTHDEPHTATACGAGGTTCATGTVSAGADSHAGGLAGTNDGRIKLAFAIGEVQVGTNATAGGLVGQNTGTITQAAAFGIVNGLGSDQLKIGGLVGENSGTIRDSRALEAVAAGADSVVGGLVAINHGTITRSHATTIAIAGHDSIVGGLVGVNDLGGIIKHSTSHGGLDAGHNSIIGGFVGVNGGDVDHSRSTAAVIGADDSYVGGFVGINIGSIIESHAKGHASVTVTGSGSVIGGFVGVNVGWIDPSTTSVTPAAGDNNIVGGFSGANLDFASFNFPSGLTLPPPPSFPTGQTNDSTTTDTAHPFSGTTSGTGGFPNIPQPISGCGDSICQIFQTGFLAAQPPSDNPTNSTPTFDQPPNQQMAPPTNNNDNTPIQINLTPGPTGPGGSGGGGGGSGSNNGGAKPNYGPSPGPGLGRTADEQQYSGVPPPNETRFRVGELVIQVVDTVQVQQVVDAAAKLGLALLSTQHLDNVRRNLFRFRATNPKADLRKLIVALEKINIFASVQPNYNFFTTQTAQAPAAPAAPPAPPPKNPDQTDSIPPANEAAPDLANSDTAALTSLPAGDAAQYVIDKFHLGAVHRLASGRNVTIAVVDSEIDVTHPDLRGVIVDRFDATQTASKPHAHGTGMAGAIASRFRLLGVAPGVRIIAIKAFDESATSAEATSYQILKGLDYAINKKVKIINMSFAGPRDPMMERTLKSAHDKGIILVAAAGNAGPKSPPLYPGADQSVIAVSATDFNDKPFAMANRGKYIAVAAPGVDVMVPAPGNGYQLTTGTSVAAAHVSGVAALLVERKPGITPDEVKALLMKTATAFSAKPKGEEDGAGLVDPAGALQALAAGAKTSEAVPSTSTARATVH